MTQDEDRAEERLPSRADASGLLDRVLADYMVRIDRGEHVDRKTLIAEHPDLAGQLSDYFDAQDAIIGGLNEGGDDARPDDPAIAEEGSIQEGLPDRYAFRSFVGRGGMGYVVRVIDRQFQRDLALKTIRIDHGISDGAVGRFRREAKITAQMQHPGVPPVHETGTLPNGSPFFTMKLVDGETLRSILSRRESPSQDASHLLGIFQQIAQTIAYAHRKGILHRDLKPDNVMVGSFGEVQVMDWGLAKLVSGHLDGSRQSGSTAKVPVEAPPVTDSVDQSIESTRQSGKAAGVSAEARSLNDSADQSIESTLARQDPDLTADMQYREERTLEGQVLGTPAYMAPEQARGEIHRVDRRTDVFGLGAILCEILTGKPPFSGANTREVLELARTGNLDDIESRLRSQPVDSDLVDLALQCLAPHPQDRPEDAGLVAQRTTAYFSRMQQRLDEAKVGRATSEARLHEERKRRKLAVVLAITLVLLVSGAAAAVTWYQHDQEVRRNELLTRTNEARQELAVATSEAELRLTAATNEASDLHAWDAELAAANSALLRARAFADDLEHVSGRSSLQQLESLEARSRVARLEYDLAQAFEQLQVEKTAYNKEKAALNARISWSRMREPLAALSIEPGITSIEKASRWIQSRPGDLTQLYIEVFHGLLLDPKEASPDALQWVGELLNRVDEDSWRRQLRVALQDTNDSNILELLNSKSTFDQPPVILVGVVDAFDQAFAGQVLAKYFDAHPNSFLVAFALGLSWRERARDYTEKLSERERESYLEKAVKCMTVARALRPDHVGNLLNLGGALGALKRNEEQLAVYLMAESLDPENPDAVNNVGTAYRDLGKTELAIVKFRRARELAPDHKQATTNLAGLVENGVPSVEVEDSFTRRIQARPDNPDGYSAYAVYLHKQGRFTEAIAQYQKALSLEKENARLYRNYSLSLSAAGKHDEALQAVTTAARLAPGYREVQYDLAGCLKRLNYHMEALDAFHAELDQNPKYARAIIDSGVVYFQLGHYDQAEKNFREGYRLDPEHINALYNLGNSLSNNGYSEQAVRVYRQYLAIAPEAPQVHCNLGNALRDSGQYQEALKSLRVGHQLGMKQAGWPYSSAVWIRKTQAFLAVKPNWKSLAADFESKPVTTQQVLAEICEHQDDLSTAVKIYSHLAQLSDEGFRRHGEDAARCSVLLASSLPDVQQEKKIELWASAPHLLTRVVQRRRASIDGKNRFLCIQIYRVLTRLLEGREWASVRGDALQSLPDDVRKPWQTLWEEIESARTECATPLRRTKKNGSQQASGNHQAKAISE